MRVLIERRQPKAKAPPLSLNSIRSLQIPPKKQTNDSGRNTDSARPPYGDGERRRYDLVAPLLSPWRERGQSRFGRVGHGSSCWLSCVCVCVCVFFFFFWPVRYLSGRKSIQPKLKWPIFPPSFQKICAQRQPISMRVQNLHNLVIMDPCLLVGEMRVLIDLSGRKKCTKILLGRVPSYFFFRSYRDFY